MSKHEDFGRDGEDAVRLRAELSSCRSGSEVLQRQIDETRTRVRVLEERILDTKGQLAQSVARNEKLTYTCLLYTSPSPRDQRGSRMPSSA